MPRKNTGKKERVSFQKEFYSDLTADSMLFGITVRSPVSRGTVQSISHPDLPEGYTLVTARDIPGSNVVSTPQGAFPVFCEGKITYEGEPVGILAGPDEAVLKRLAGELIFSISTDEESLPPPEESADKAPAPEIPEKQKRTAERTAEKKASAQTEKTAEQPSASGVIAERTFCFGPCFEKKQGSLSSGIEAVFKNAKYTAENEWTYALKTPDYGEPNGAMCSWKDDALTISTPTQWLNSLRRMASESLAVNPEAITIRKTTSTNRGTAGIWYNSIIACQVAAASKKTGKPVKLVYSRNEQETFLNTMQPISIRHRTAVNEKGEIEAMEVHIEVNAGFTNPFAQEIIDRLVIASCGCYSPKNMMVKATARSSARPASSVDIQLIDSAAFFAVENQMNELCGLCNLTPVEFRQRNFLSAGMGKKKIPAVPFLFGIEKFSETMEAVSKISDLNRKHASYHLDAMNWKTGSGPKEYVSVFSSPMRGIGFACAFEGTGYYGSELYYGSQSIEATLESESVLVIHCLPISNSIHEIWAGIAAEILDIPFLNVKINSVFKNGEEPTLPENMYSNISIMTSLLKKCCTAIKKKKGTETLPITVKKKTALSQRSGWSRELFSGKPFHSTSFAAATVEVEINPCTYREELRSIHIVLNGGKILKTQAAASSVKLGIQKILSSLLEDDRIECKNIKVSFMKSELDPSQIGELAYQVIPAAYTHALTQALNCTVNSLPLTTESLYKKIKEQKAKIKARKESEQNSADKKDSPQAQEEKRENENSAVSEQ